MKLFTKEINDKLYKQYPKGGDLENQVVVAKIFNPYGNGRWFLLNSDPQDPDYLWAIVEMGKGNVEIGSVSRRELESIRVTAWRFPLERDLSFRPINAKMVYDGLLQGKHFDEGGEVENENKEMLENQATEIKHHSEELKDALKDTKEVEPWVVAKAERSATDLSDITHYLEGESKSEYARGGEISIKVGDKVKQRKKMGSVVYGVEGEVYEVDGSFFKLQDKFGNKSSKLHNIKDFKPSDIKSMAKGGRLDVGRYYRTTDGRQVRYLGDSTDPELGTFMNKNQEVFKVRYDEITGKASLFEDGGMMAKGGKIDVAKIKKEYDENEENNAHSENVVLLAKHFGSESDLRDAKTILAKHESIGYMPSYLLKERDELATKLYKKMIEAQNKMASGGMTDESIFEKFITSQINYVISLKTISEKKDVINNLLKNMSDYVGEDIQKRITTDNLKYALTQKTSSDINKVLKTTLNALDKGNIMASGGMMAKGGQVYVDLFENRDEMPYKVKVILDRYEDEYGEDISYQGLLDMQKEVEEVGYTFDFGLDSSPYGLRPIGVEITQLEGYEGYGEDEMASGGMMADGGKLANGKYKYEKGDEGMFMGDEVRVVKLNVGYGIYEFDIIDEDGKVKSHGVAKMEKFEKQFRYFPKMAKGGRVKFADKVEAVKKSLLERKKVPKAVQKDYGKTFSPAEAEDSAKRIVGAQTARERLKARIKSKKK